MYLAIKLIGELHIKIGVILQSVYSFFPGSINTGAQNKRRLNYIGHCSTKYAAHLKLQNKIILEKAVVA
jgi:hypothetical protein